MRVRNRVAVRMPPLDAVARRAGGAEAPPTGGRRGATGPARRRLRAAHQLLVALDTRQDGQLTVLLLGLVLLILMVLALGWDTSNWLIGRRALNDLADGAAAAAAGAVDVERFYGSDGRSLRLSQAAATATVRDVLAAAPVDGIAAAVSTGTGPDGRPRATVRLRAPASTTFLHLLGLVAPEMSAEAVATAVRVAPPGRDGSGTAPDGSAG